MRVQNLAKAFGGQTVLDGVGVELRAGEVVLLRGANGSGKTTLLNLLTGNLEPDSGMIQLFINGESELFRFPLPWWQKLNPWNHFTPERVAQEGVGRTWQEIRLFNTQTLLDNIAVATPQQLGENPLAAIAQRAAVVRQEKGIRQEAGFRLAQLGLGGREQSSAERVSLGQSKRVAIARAVQGGAKILFFKKYAYILKYGAKTNNAAWEKPWNLSELLNQITQLEPLRQGNLDLLQEDIQKADLLLNQSIQTLLLAIDKIPQLPPNSQEKERHITQIEQQFETIFSPLAKHTQIHLDNYGKNTLSGHFRALINHCKNAPDPNPEHIAALQEIIKTLQQQSQQLGEDLEHLSQK